MNKNILLAIIAIVLIGGGVFILFQKQSATPVGNKIQQEGPVLAGKTSPYLAFTKAEYDKALADGKIVFLDFYANWCPICRSEAPELKAGFDALTTDKVVGFRVNFNDSDTDADEKALAKQFNIPYQHTKVILKGGREVFRSADQWDKEMFLREINTLVGN